MVDNKRLDELMLENYPGMVYSAEQTDLFLKNFRGNLEDEVAVVQDFAAFIDANLSKFIIIKTIGKYNNFVVREFNNENEAKKFVDLLRKSEQLDFVKYSISQVINY